MKLYTYPGSPNVFKILIAAEYNGIEIELPEFDVAMSKSKSFLAKNPLGKAPVLETDEGSIFESGAIARYIARFRADTKLLGSTFFDSAQVDCWIDFNTHYVEVPTGLIMHMITGYVPFDAAAKAKAMSDIKNSLQIIENHLVLRTYLVGESISLADIVLASTLLYPMKFFMDKEFRKPYPALNRYLQTLYNQPQFQAVLGDVPLCDVPTLAKGDEGEKKKATAPAPKKAAAKVEEPPKPKKVEHPLAVLNRKKPSNFIMDPWKVEYSNAKDLKDAMKYFWEHIDMSGYSIWFCDYKYNDENKKIFMTSNAVRGFIQRTDALRKFAFGVMHVCGQEGEEISITGCWLFRGDSVQYMMEENPDAEYYTWNKVTDLDDVTKARVAAYWCNKEELEGRVIADYKVFK